MRCAHLNIETNALCICGGRKAISSAKCNSTRASPRPTICALQIPLQDSSVLQMCTHFYALWLILGGCQVSFYTFCIIDTDVCVTVQSM